MAVEVTTAGLFEQIGKLFVEVRGLTAQNEQLEQAVKALQAKLAEGTTEPEKKKS